MGLNGTVGGITDIEIGNLDDLLDVTLAAPTSGQFLQYDATNSRWINASAATGGGGGTGTVTSAGVTGTNGIVAGGSPITTEGVIALSLLDITPRNVVASGDISATTGRISASAATLTGKLTGAQAAFSGKVSADAGLNTTTLSAASIGLTGDMTADRVTVSAATISGTPTNSTDAATKGYVDNLFAGFSPRSSCRLATTANLNATYLNGSSGLGATLANAGSLAAFSLDGVNAALGDRVLIKNQSTDLQNGIYTVTTVGSGIVAWVLTRATDYDQSAEVFEGTYTDVVEGNTQAETQWVMTKSGTITMGATSITFGELLVAAQTVTLTGDVSGSGAGSFAATINPAAVTNAKLANMNAVTLKCNPTTSAAAPTDASFSTFVDAAVSGAQGDILYRGASGWVKLAAGTAGQLLSTGGVSANPTWTSTLSATSVNTTTVSAASIGVTGDINASTGRVIASAMRVTALLSADGGLRTTSVSASGVIGGSNLSGTNTGDQTITLTGDVSGSGTGSFAATINPNAVTYAKMQTVSASRLLGNPYAAASAVSEIGLGAGLIFTAPNVLLDTSAQNAWTAQQGFAIATLTDASSINWNLKSQQVAQLTIAGAGTRQLQDPTNMANGNTYILKVTKASAQSCTIAFTSAYRWPNSTAPTLSTGSAATDIFTFICVASSMYGSFTQNYSAP